MKLFYSDDYVAAGHSFDTTRKSKWIADSLHQAPIRGVAILAPRPLTREDVTRVHSRAYVDAVATGEPRDAATSQGFDWDAGLWKAVCASNGGAVAGMDPYEGCSIGGLHGITAEMLGLREAMVFDWARRRKLPIAFVLAGGYTRTSLDRAQLVDLHRLTLSAAAGLHVLRRLRSRTEAADLRQAKRRAP